MKDLVAARAVFCDDARQELGHKVSLMGIYTGDMVIEGKAPVSLPKLCIAIWVNLPKDKKFKSMAVISEGPSLERKGRMEFTHDELDGTAQSDGSISYQFAAVWAQIPIIGDGPIETYIDIDGKRYFAGSVNVIFQEEATSS
ncbi:hypothetical protein [Nitrospirillum viridazoti]|uniref:hypothetical protein n=1 Tax=Nitrospirillum viridazoti TaxID=3144925 RepID=UPI00110F8049|nr:hypothetical protein [Nitrospirillum amazonense]